MIDQNMESEPVLGVFLPHIVDPPSQCLWKMTQQSSDKGGAVYPRVKSDDQRWVAHTPEPVRSSKYPNSGSGMRHSRCNGVVRVMSRLQEKCAVIVSRHGGIFCLTIFFKYYTMFGVYFYEDLWSKLTVCNS